MPELTPAMIAPHLLAVKKVGSGGGRLDGDCLSCRWDGPASALKWADALADKGLGIAIASEPDYVRSCVWMPADRRGGKVDLEAHGGRACLYFWAQDWRGNEGEVLTILRDLAAHVGPLMVTVGGDPLGEVTPCP